jgi:hypothetical protein
VDAPSTQDVRGDAEVFGRIPPSVILLVSGTLNQSLPEAMAAAPSVDPTPVEKMFTAP